MRASDLLERFGRSHDDGMISVELVTDLDDDPRKVFKRSDTADTSRLTDSFVRCFGFVSVQLCSDPVVLELHPTFRKIEIIRIRHPVLLRTDDRSQLLT